MPNKRTRGPAVDDVEVLRLNSLGYSLHFISRNQNCHPTTVTNRLNANGVEPVDTRRSLMEDVYKRIPPPLIGKLSNKLGPHYTIKDHITNLLIKDLLST
jgi:hypothetical protein